VAFAAVVLGLTLSTKIHPILLIVVAGFAGWLIF